MRVDRQSESGDIEDLKYKMAIGRGQVVRQSAKSPTGLPPSKKTSANLIPKPVPTQMLADVQP